MAVLGDGEVDESFTEVPTGNTCGLGVCTNQETVQCVGGVEVEVCNPLPQALQNDPTCNNINEDCE